MAENSVAYSVALLAALKVEHWVALTVVETAESLAVMRVE